MRLFVSLNLDYLAQTSSRASGYLGGRKRKGEARRGPGLGGSARRVNFTFSVVSLRLFSGYSRLGALTQWVASGQL